MRRNRAVHSEAQVNAAARHAHSQVIAILKQARDDGAYDGARWSLGRPSAQKLIPENNALGDLLDLRRAIYDHAWEQAKRASQAETAAGEGTSREDKRRMSRMLELHEDDHVWHFNPDLVAFVSDGTDHSDNGCTISFAGGWELESSLTARQVVDAMNDSGEPHE